MGLLNMVDCNCQYPHTDYQTISGHDKDCQMHIQYVRTSLKNDGDKCGSSGCKGKLLDNSTTRQYILLCDTCSYEMYISKSRL